MLFASGNCICTSRFNNSVSHSANSFLKGGRPSIACETSDLRAYSTYGSFLIETSLCRICLTRRHLWNVTVAVLCAVYYALSLCPFFFRSEMLQCLIHTAIPFASDNNNI